MVLYYEVYEKGTSWDGPKFPTVEECNRYIEGQIFLSERNYMKGKTADDFEICTKTYNSVADILSDEYGEDEYEEFLKNS